MKFNNSRLEKAEYVLAVIDGVKYEFKNVAVGDKDNNLMIIDYNSNMATVFNIHRLSYYTVIFEED